MGNVYGSSRVGDIQHLRAVVVASLGDGVRETTGRIDAPEENVDERISTFLSGKSSEYDGGDVRVVVERFHIDSAGGVENDGRVAALRGDGSDEGLSSVPESQVVSISHVAVDGDLQDDEVSVRDGKDESEGNQGKATKETSDEIEGNARRDDVRILLQSWN